MQKKKGISLIVLVITIIVMIILAATIIISINNANVMQKANEAVEASDIATIKSAADLKYAEYIMDKSIIGKATLEEWLNNELKGMLKDTYLVKVLNNETVVVKKGTLASAFITGEVKVGDYVNYKTTVTSEENANWRVLGLDENTGEVLLTIEGTSKNKVTLNGKEGYFNGENTLNNACSEYGKGLYATGARSINREDILKLTGVNENNILIPGGIYEMLVYDIARNVNITMGNEMSDVWSLRKGGNIIKEDFKVTPMIYHLGDKLEDGTVKSEYTFKLTGLWFDIENYLQNSAKEYSLLFKNSQGSNVGYFIANKVICNYDVGILEDEALSYGIDFIGSKYYSYASLVECDESGCVDMQVQNYLKPVVSISQDAKCEAASSINSINAWNLK